MWETKRCHLNVNLQWQFRRATRAECHYNPCDINNARTPSSTTLIAHPCYLLRSPRKFSYYLIPRTSGCSSLSLLRTLYSFRALRNSNSRRLRAGQLELGKKTSIIVFRMRDDTGALINSRIIFLIESEIF